MAAARVSLIQCDANMAKGVSVSVAYLATSTMVQTRARVEKPTLVDSQLCVQVLVPHLYEVIGREGKPYTISTMGICPFFSSSA